MPSLHNTFFRLLNKLICYKHYSWSSLYRKCHASISHMMEESDNLIFLHVTITASFNTFNLRPTCTLSYMSGKEGWALYWFLVNHFPNENPREFVNHMGNSNCDLALRKISPSFDSPRPLRAHFSVRLLLTIEELGLDTQQRSGESEWLLSKGD